MVAAAGARGRDVACVHYCTIRYSLGLAGYLLCILDDSTLVGTAPD